MTASVTTAAALDLERDGAALHAAALSGDAIETLRVLADNVTSDRPGARLRHATGLHDLLAPSGAIGRVAHAALGDGVRPVRAVMFDKSETANWAVAWHQDRTVPVAERAEAAEFGPWSRKDGVWHVAPPIEVLDRMVTLRAHLDDCDADNAPLLIALGSHRLGKVAATAAALEASCLPQHVCLASAGDVWIFRTPILHASERAARARRRRVLQVDFAAFDLPAPLRWRGLAAL